MAQKPHNKLRKWLSFNQHRKRWGAGTVMDTIHRTELSALKSKFISGNELVYTYGSSKNINTHIEDLRNEFIGMPELLYYHAKLIVLIRREVDIAENYAHFEYLWQQESAFLLAHMNTRWLVAACDTFADHSIDTTVQAICLSASMFINTIKLAETERFMLHATQLSYDNKQIKTLQTERVALGDGTSAFAVGTDDSLRNMRWRMSKILSYPHASAAILKMIFDRASQFESVYSRFKAMHTRAKTAWW